MVQLGSLLGLLSRLFFLLFPLFLGSLGGFFGGLGIPLADLFEGVILGVIRLFLFGKELYGDAQYPQRQSRVVLHGDAHIDMHREQNHE